MSGASAVRFASVSFASISIVSLLACVGDSPDLSTVKSDGVDAGGAEASVEASVSTGKKLVFVTSYKKQGNMGGVGGDEICRVVSQKPTTAWRAWLSTDTYNAIDRVGEGPWYRTDGELVFANKAALANPPNVPLNLDEIGNPVPNDDLVWTGTNAGGQAIPPRCSEWTNITPLGWTGKVGERDKTWTESSIVSCNTAAHLYCFEL